MHVLRRLWPIRLNSLSTKLYCVAALSIIAISGLATASIYFAKTTETAAQRLYGDGFVGVINSTRLELLLEEHRRIVESMPAEVDRERLDHGRTRLNEIGTRLSSLIAELTAEQGDPAPGGIEREISKSFAPLFQLGDRVAFYAIEFAQDKALEIAEQYASQADKTKQHTSVAIPSSRDRDEVGDMARAVEVFKDNAIQLRAREIELQLVNRRLDVA
jgi:hypothetical protein